MSLKTRAILVIVIGTIMGLGLSLGGGILQHREPTLPDDLSWEQARLFAEVMERVKRDLGQSTGVVIYARNLRLIHKQNQRRARAELVGDE